MGGVSIYVVNLASALKKRNHKVWVSSSGGELVKKLRAEEIAHLKSNIDTKSELNPKLMAGIYRLYWVIKENGIDIIHTNTRVAQVMGEILSFLTGACHVSTCHGFFRPGLGRRLFGCWGKKVIAISDAVREHLVNDFDVPKTRIALIHNGINLEVFDKPHTQEDKKIIKRELRLKEGPVVGIIARLSSVKGHKFIIEAMKAVVRDIDNAQLLIVGEGEEEQNLKDLAKELGLSDSVIFAKFVLDTAGVLAVMDVFVLYSIKEGLGLALIEALCCGVPVVASDVGGVYSVVKDGTTGLLVPPKEPFALAEAILKLLKDRQLAVKLAESGRRFVRANFSLEQMGLKVEAAYKEALK